MNAEIRDFGRPTEIADLKVGDLFVVSRDGVALLGMRVEDEDSVFDLFLSATGTVPGCPSAPFWLNPGVLSEEPCALVEAKLVIQPVLSQPPQPDLAPAQEGLKEGHLVVDADGMPFIFMRYQPSPISGSFFIHLLTGKKDRPRKPMLSYRAWEIVRIDDKGDAHALAAFPAPAQN